MPQQYNPQQQMQMGFPSQGQLNPFAQRGQRDLILLNQLAQGFAPVVTAPQPQMRTGFESLPGFNQPGLMGMIMNFGVAPMLQQQMAKTGMMPGGLSSQNMMDFIDAQEYQTDQRKILDQLGGKSEEGYFQTLRGMQALTGGPFNAPQRAAARNLASTAAGMTGTLAPFAPELIDQLSGRQGSAAVMGMRMQQFNRYKVDPVTGQMGYSAESNIQQAEEVFDEMYAPDNMAKMRGMRAGQLGGMYGEMMKRGMIGGDSRPYRARVEDAARGVLGGGDAESIEAIRDLGLPTRKDRGGADTGEIDFQNLDSDQMDKLRGLEGVQGEMRSFDSSKVKRSLEGYVDAVTSMREIFGDAGVSNAPMSQLIKGLEALSQGSMTQIDPQSLNVMVRTTEQLAKQSGMTIDSAIMMQQQGAKTLESLGVERIFAPALAQGAMAFGQAGNAAGVGANPAWGLEGMDFQRQLDQNARARAVASPLTNAMGALLRAEEQFGGFTEQRGDETNEEYKKRKSEDRTTQLAEAIKGGRTEYTYVDEDGKSQTGSVYKDSNLIQGMIARQGVERGGLTEDAAGGRALRAMTQEGANRERAFEVNAQDITRRLQSNEIREELLNPRAEGVFKGYDVSEEDAQKMADAFSETFTTMDRETATDTKKRNQAFARAMRAKGIDESITDEQLEAMSEDAFGSVDRAIRDPNNPYSGYRSVQNLMVQTNEGTLRDANNRRRMAGIDATIKDSMTGLTGHGLLGNLVTAVQEAGEDETKATLTDVLGKTFGGIQLSEMTERLEAPMEELRRARENVDELRGKVDRTEDGPDKERLIQDLEESQRTLKTKADALRTLSEKEGLLEQKDILDVEDINNYEAAEETRQQNQMTAASFMIRPFGGETDPQKIDRGRRTGLLLKEGEGPEQIGAIISGAPAERLLDEFAGEIEEEERQEARKAENAKLKAAGEEELGEDEEVDEDAVAAIRTKLERGEQKLSDSQTVRLLEARRETIRIAPTEKEVDDEIKETLGDKGFEELGEDDDTRRMFAAVRSTEARMQRDGVTQEDLENKVPEITMADVDKNLARLGVPPQFIKDVPPEKKQMMLNQLREREATTIMSKEALTAEGGVRALRDRFENDMTREQRQTMGAASKDAFTYAQGLIEATGTARFVEQAGGAGLALRDELEDLQAEEVLLLKEGAGGSGLADRAAMEAGALPVGVDADKRLEDYFLTENNTNPDKFFYREEELDESGKKRKAGELRDEYATGVLEGLTREDFKRGKGEAGAAENRENRALLARLDIKDRYDKVHEKIGRVSDQLVETIGARGGRFTVTPSDAVKEKARELKMDATELQSLKSSARLEGVDISDERLQELTTGVGRGGEGADHIAAPATAEEAQVMKVAEASRAMADLYKKDPKSFAAVRAMSVDQIGEDEYLPEEHGGLTRDEFVTAREQFEVVRASRGKAVDRMEEADLSDPTRAMEAIGEAMGLADTDLEKFRTDRTLAPKMATAEGQAWTREITGSIETIRDASGGGKGADTQLFKDIQSALSGEPMTEALAGRADSAELLSSGKMLEHAGVLEQLAEGGTPDIDALRDAITKLQESQKVVEDVKEKTMRISGTLQVSGKTAQLTATSGTNPKS